MVSAHRHRLAARVLVFDREDRVLLFLTTAPDSSGIARWLTPGGGVDAGEGFEEAARRELFEETGLEVGELGAPVWAHDYDVEWDSADHDSGHAEFFTVVTDRFEPSSAHWTAEEQVDVLEHRWWSLAELLAERPRFEPAELIELVRRQLPSCTA
ncbi:NUDIX hydrolase [Protaetiibacter intestinalis]|uniref:NUDIX domain-containing protein n=1 Tax=Protaetiibacter intestinalis TaxID=2419774 RepID=A0A387BDN0_9MICO|nr:NUDIX domain-containing protein [Protaetiibacter intestinalis]AYF98999.1 NUDIX domain-containing protein [Protaetiibacter intestinalis]